MLLHRFVQQQMGTLPFYAVVVLVPHLPLDVGSGHVNRWAKEHYEIYEHEHSHLSMPAPSTKCN
jgi:hypothetical protein